MCACVCFLPLILSLKTVKAYHLNMCALDLPKWLSPDVLSKACVCLCACVFATAFTCRSVFACMDVCMLAVGSLAPVHYIFMRHAA